MSETANTTPATQTPTSVVYFVAFTGGHEDPSFFATTDQNKAVAKYDQWAQDADADAGDKVSFLVFNGETLRHG